MILLHWAQWFYLQAVKVVLITVRKERLRNEHMTRDGNWSKDIWCWSTSSVHVILGKQGQRSLFSFGRGSGCHLFSLTCYSFWTHELRDSSASHFSQALQQCVALLEQTYFLEKKAQRHFLKIPYVLIFITAAAASKRIKSAEGVGQADVKLCCLPCKSCQATPSHHHAWLSGLYVS